MFKKQKDEIKNDIKEEISELMESGKVVSLGIMAISCLTVGYILGSITTGAMYRTIIRVNH